MSIARARRTARSWASVRRPTCSNSMTMLSRKGQRCGTTASHVTSPERSGRASSQPVGRAHAALGTANDAGQHSAHHACIGHIGAMQEPRRAILGLTRLNRHHAKPPQPAERSASSPTAKNATASVDRAGKQPRGGSSGTPLSRLPLPHRFESDGHHFGDLAGRGRLSDDGRRSRGEQVGLNGLTRGTTRLSRYRRCCSRTGPCVTGEISLQHGTFLSCFGSGSFGGETPGDPALIRWRRSPSFVPGGKLYPPLQASLVGGTA